MAFSGGVSLDLPPEFQDRLVTELREVAKLVRDGDNDRQKAFFYSAAAAIFDRTLRFHFDPSLQVGFLLLNYSYGQMNAVATQIAAGDPLIPVADGVWEGIAGALEELSKRIKASKEFGDVLERVVLLTFITTGAGYYMYRRGELKKALSGLVK